MIRLYFLAVGIILTITSMATASECLGFYQTIKVEIPSEIKDKFSKAEAAAKLNATHANFIRTLDADGRVIEIVFLNTEILQTTSPGGKINFEVRYNFENRKDRTKHSLPADAIEWLQESDVNRFSASTKIWTNKVKWLVAKAAIAFETTVNRAFDLTISNISKTKVASDSIEVILDAGIKAESGSLILSELESFDNTLASLGLRKPQKTHVYVGRHGVFSGGTRQFTTPDIRSAIQSIKPTEQEQYLIVNSVNIDAAAVQSILRQRFLSYLKINFNRDGLLKEENSFIATDPTLSTALADFVVAHLSNNPVIGLDKRNIATGQIGSKSIVSVKDMARFGGDENSLLISRTLWDYRELLGVDKMNQWLPRILWSLATLRKAYTEGELFRRHVRAKDPDHYDYLRGKSNDRATSLQYEIDNLKFFMSALILAQDMVPADLANAVEPLIQQRIKDFGFVLNPDSVNDRGAIGTIIKNIIPLVFPGHMKDYPSLPVIPKDLVTAPKESQ